MKSGCKNENFPVVVGIDWADQKGYWKLSRTLATNMGMGNAWLTEQGLISLKEQCSRMHYPA